MHLDPPTPAQARLLAQLQPLLPKFAARAPAADREARFPFENITDLQATGYLAAPLPAASDSGAGGGGHGLADMVCAQLALARADGSTAYMLGMHFMTIATEAAAHAWPDAARTRIFADVVQNGALCNQIATEPDLGSPQGGGRPQTTLTPDGPGRWRLNGHKSFATLAPALHWFITYVALEDGSGEVGRVAVHRTSPGLRIDETWDALGLRSTGSHDVYYDQVAITDADILLRLDPQQSRPRDGDFAWFALMVTSAALGIADAARDEAVRFARTRRPTGYAQPISQIPSVREQIARIDLDLMAAHTLLLGTARAWDAQPQRRGAALAPYLAAAKIQVTNTAISVVDRCMRVVGGVSLHRGAPLERYYRDVRGALHNPPIEPRGLEVIARAALDDA